jgi:hypothetical protein
MLYPERPGELWCFHCMRHGSYRFQMKCISEGLMNIHMPSYLNYYAEGSRLNLNVSPHE